MGRLLEAARTNVKVALRDGGKTLPAGEAVRVGGYPHRAASHKASSPIPAGVVQFRFRNVFWNIGQSVQS